MSNSYHFINMGTKIIDIKTALEDKYGAGVTIHHETLDYLIFSCGAISDKVISIYFQSDRLRLYYGTGYNGTTTLLNQQLVHGYTGYHQGTSTLISLIVGDSFIMFSYNGGTNLNNCICVAGKLSNGKSVILSYVGATSPYVGSFKTMNITDGVDGFIVSFPYPFASASGKLYKQPIIFQRLDGKAEQNIDGSIASINGLYNISHQLNNTSDLVGLNYIFTASNLNTGSTSKILYTSLFAEF